MIATLTLDRDRSAIQTTMLLPAIVGFYFSFRLLSVLLSVRLLHAEPQTGAAVNLALNFLLVGVAAFSSLGPGVRSFASFLSIPSFCWVLFFLAFTGLSLMWSSTTSMSAAIAYWCAMASDVAIVVLLLRIGSVDGTALSLMKGYAWGAVAIALIAWILPSQSDLRLGDEELLGPNQIGYACAFAFLLAQYMMRKGERGLTIPAAFLAITLLRSLSKTTIVAFVTCEVLLLALDKSISRKTKVYLAVAAIAVVAAFSGLLEAYYEVYTNAGNQSETLTGRIGIWAYILNEALQQPWIGHGFHSVWKVIPPFGVFEARHAHNEILQQFYAYGVVGVAMLAVIYGSVFREIRKLHPSSVKTFFIGMMLFILVRGAADTEVFDLSLPTWLIVLIGLILSQEQRLGEAVA
jgi:exopolysaccharide production protein ExoQ